MNVDELMAGNVIQTLDTQKIINDTLAKIAKHPKNSLSQREIVESINLGEMSFEEAQKIADNLNAEVTKTIQAFSKKLKTKN